MPVLPLATLEATAASVKYWSAAITPVTAENSSTGEMLGRVMYQSFCRPPAPSSSAASYWSFGTSSSAARKITMTSPIIQTPSSSSDGLDRDGSLNQSGPLIPKVFSSVFTGPVPGLKRNTKPTTDATGGTSAGT